MISEELTQVLLFLYKAFTTYFYELYISLLLYNNILLVRRIDSTISQFVSLIFLRCCDHTPFASKVLRSPSNQKKICSM